MCMYRESHHAQFHDVVGQTKTNLNMLEESSIDDLCKNAEDGTLSES